MLDMETFYSMLIYSNPTARVRVLQHPYLTVFHVQKYMLGDCSHSYGQTWDYFTVLETSSIEEVNKKVKEIIDNQKES